MNLPAPAAVDTHRETIIRRLTDHFGTDQLELDELETRLERAHEAQTIEALDALVADLTPIPAHTPAAVETGLTVTSDAPPFGKAWSIMGETTKKGSWVVPKRLESVSVMGSVVLDFREARMGPGTTELYAKSIMGSIEIIVPPDLRVQCEGMGILGAFEDKSQGIDAPPDGPLLHIKGVAVMGAVEIKTRRVGESGWQALKRHLLGISPSTKQIGPG